MKVVIREHTETQTVVVKKRYCDVCGEELGWTLQCSKAKCVLCGKDLCEKCVGYEEETGGDYRRCWCKHCWEVGEPFRNEMERLRSLIEDQHHLWKMETMKKKRYV